MLIIVALAVSLPLPASQSLPVSDTKITVQITATPTTVADFDFEIEMRAAQRLAATMTLRKQEWANLIADSIATTQDSQRVVVDDPELADVLLQITGGYDSAIAPYIDGLRLEAVLRSGRRTRPVRVFYCRSFEEMLPTWLPRLEQSIRSLMHLPSFVE